MPKMFLIKEGGIPIGFFQNETDRDLAFEEYVVPKSNNCMKGEMKVGI